MSRSSTWWREAQAIAGALGAKDRPRLACARETQHVLATGEYSRMLAAQGHGCYVCGEPEPRTGKGFFVDVTNGTARLLCRSCFKLAVYLRASKRLRLVVAYVEVMR